MSGGTVSNSRRPVIGLTAGDPSGIGPETLAAALQKGAPEGVALRLIGRTNPLHSGKPSAQSAMHALEALEEAAHLLLRGELDGIVTGPVCKDSLAKIGFPFPGQTEFFAARANVENFAMLLTGGPLTVALVTAHVPLREVPSRLSTTEVTRVGSLLADYLQRLGNPAPRIAVAGLNPHAGENGLLGREEIETITPAVRELCAGSTSATFSGPHPPDTIFRAAAGGEFDAVLCMYHDQGLIPLKLIAFDQGVNVTLGLPFVRTSPDHGTAFSIAGKNIARPDSHIAAISLAARLCQNSGAHGR